MVFRVRKKGVAKISHLGIYLKKVREVAAKSPGRGKMKSRRWPCTWYLISVLLFTGTPAFCQELPEKYQSIRQRFLDRFYFQGLVAEYIDETVPGRKVKFADQTIYMGQALMALATEMKLRRQSGASVDDTKARIGEVLTAIERLDEVADPRFGATSALDGFFVRDDIAGPGDPRLGGKFAQCESDWQFPEKENASPSGDQVFGLMFGLWAVGRFGGEAPLTEQARGISSRLYDYTRRNYFMLTLPNGDPTKRGPDLRYLASLLHGLNQHITGQDLFSESKIKVEIPFLGEQVLPLNGVASFWDAPWTAKQVADLTGRSLKIPIINKELQLNSFAIHQLLMALAPSDVWSQDEFEAVGNKANHHLSVLIFCAAHGTKPKTFEPQVVERILAACPVSGPRSNLAKETGWHEDSRWIRCLDLADPHEPTNYEYNGLDWLLLHNFHELVYSNR